MNNEKIKFNKHFAWDKLTTTLPDLEKHIKDNEIKIIPLPANTKAPNGKGWNRKKYSMEEIQEHTGNYGILIGYGNKKNGYSISCIDIDGYKTTEDNPDPKIKQATKEHIYQALKDLPNTLQVKTQSGGYHIYLWTKQVNPSTSETSKSLYFPKDFKIKSLAGKPLKDSIEIFTNEGKKQTVLPSSTIFDKSTNELREYKVISELNKFSDIDITDNINQLVIKTLKAKGYTYKKHKNHSKQSTKKFTQRKTDNSQDDNLLKLSNKQIKEVVRLVTPIFKVTEGAKHKTALYLGGYFSYHITKLSTSKIANGIIRKIGKRFDDSQAFKHTLLQNYSRDGVDKAGLPKLSNHITSYDKNFNITQFTDKLNSICNPKFTKELVSNVFINDNQIPIYLYEDESTKWLRYESVFPDLDLILNLNTKIGSFNHSKTNKELTSFKFKFGNRHFDIQKKDLESITYFLSTENEEYKLPKFFTEIIRTSLKNLDTPITNPKELSKVVTLKNLFVKREREKYARKELGNYLHQNGTILRRGINKPYIANEYNGYDSVEIDDILDYLYNTGDFQLNTIHTDDIKQALGFISERIKPSYNIVKFKNCLYDIKNFTVMETPDKPILTLTEVQYDYNPEAKGNLVVKFLETSLKQTDDTPEKLQERVTSVYEMIGYLLTSGNKKNAWFIITGIGGAGKGVLTRLIISIFGAEKVGDLKLQELTPDNRFATSHLESKQVNIVRDSPKKPIEDTGMLKSITGYDDIGIEPKGKDKYILPKEEVPDMITVCNNIPRFKEGFDESILQRAIIFEFLNLFRGTKKQNENLEDEILNNPEEMEFLIYQSIQAYKEMVQTGKDFKARVTQDKTMELLGKHTDPITYILPKLVKYNHNTDNDEEDNILTNELNKLVLYVGEQEGLNITGLNKDGLIKSNVLMEVIRREFNFNKEYTTKSKRCIYNEKTKKWEYGRVYPQLCKTQDYDTYLNKWKYHESQKHK